MKQGVLENYRVSKCKVDARLVMSRERVVELGFSLKYSHQVMTDYVTAI